MPLARIVYQPLKRSKFKRLLKDHVNAQKDLAVIGAADPHDHDAIKHNARLARKKLYEYMEEYFSDDEMPF
jgi:hypothetical protein